MDGMDQTSREMRERVIKAAEDACLHAEGDIAEIGCHVGRTTQRLAEVATLYGRRVVAVDPWQEGTQSCYGGEFEAFTARMQEHADIVDVVRVPSTAPEAIEAVSRPLAFAFVDGVHQYNEVLSDLRAVAHADLICADDVAGAAWVGVAKAVAQFCEESGRQVHIKPGWREAYLVQQST